MLEPLFASTKKRFDKIFFMNDVTFCFEDALRMLNYKGVDVVSGFDIISIPYSYSSPSLLNPFQYKMRREQILYDTWVARDL